MKSQIKLLLCDYLLRNIIVAMVVSFAVITGIAENNYDVTSITAILTYFKQYFSIMMLGNGIFLSVFLGKEYESGTIYQLYIIEGKMKFWINKIVIGIVFVLVVQICMFFTYKMIYEDSAMYSLKFNLLIFIFVVVEAIFIIAITSLLKSSTSGIVLSIIVFLAGETPLYFISPLKLFMDYVYNSIIM